MGMGRKMNLLWGIGDGKFERSFQPTDRTADYG
jgi:hypothetical protein